MHGPITADMSIALVPNSFAIRPIVAWTILSDVPFHPEWIAAQALLRLSYSNIGTQSAVLTPILKPGLSVITASIPVISLIS